MRMLRVRRCAMWMSFIVVLALLGSCESTRFSVNLPVPGQAANPSGFKAGAAKIDITPMPGYPMGGHAIASTIARGYWLRLHARSIYLEDPDGNALVLSSCDLWSMPAGLADRVSELLAAHQETAHIGREQIIFAATHTHHSPGNFSTSVPYNMLGSRRPGFDRQLFDFLATRIARSIRQACVAAEAADPHRSEIPDVAGLFRNRSLPAFKLNGAPGRALIRDNQLLPVGVGDPKAYPPDAYHAVDPRVTTLWFRRADSSVIAAAVFVAVHPTSLRSTAPLYNSDLLGVATAAVERKLRADDQRGRRPVVAVFNGAEGDISPDWKRQDGADVLRLGGILARAVGQSRRAASAVSAPGIEYSYAVTAINGRPFTDEVGRHHQTASEPLPGVALLAGAEDGRPFTSELGWIEGVTGIRTEADHGAKHPAFDLRFDEQLLPPIVRCLLGLFAPNGLTRAVFPVDEVPKKVPLGVYRLGDLAIVTVPGEFTVAMGMRVRQAVAAELDTHPSDVLIVGLANEYLSYFATPEEYEAQHYEGASTLFGAASGPYLLSVLRDLAGNPMIIPGDERRRTYDPGESHSFGPVDIGHPPSRIKDGLELALVDDDGWPREHRFVCQWKDDAPQFPLKENQRATPQIRLQERKAGLNWEDLLIGQTAETDEGHRFVTVLLKVEGARSRWASIWLPEDNLVRDLVGRTIRFAVTTVDGAALVTDGFAVDAYSSPLTARPR